MTSLNAESHDPQSRSIAVLVARDVVRGPGVRRMGSREGRLMSISDSWRAARGSRPGLSFTRPSAAL